MISKSDFLKTLEFISTFFRSSLSSISIEKTLLLINFVFGFKSSSVGINLNLLSSKNPCIAKFMLTLTKKKR